MAMTTQNLGKVGLVDKQTYDSSVEYSRLDFVTDENNISTYISLVDNNIGNPLSDQTKWRFLAKGKANTPQEALELILQADGHGSGLDADKLDGTELVDIVNPEEVTSASPFDFFLGAKEVKQGDGTKKWVFQKMSPQTMATVAAGLFPIASPSNIGLCPKELFPLRDGDTTAEVNLNSFKTLGRVLCCYSPKVTNNPSYSGSYYMGVINVGFTRMGQFVQFAVANSDSGVYKIHHRCCYSGDRWTSWVELY